MANKCILLQFLTVKQILLISIIGSVWRNAWRIFTVVFGFKRFNGSKLLLYTFFIHVKCTVYFPS